MMVSNLLDITQFQGLCGIRAGDHSVFDGYGVISSRTCDSIPRRWGSNGGIESSGGHFIKCIEVDSVDWVGIWTKMDRKTKNPEVT